MNLKYTNITDYIKLDTNISLLHNQLAVFGKNCHFICYNKL